MKDKRKGPSMFVRPREAIQISLNFSTIEPDGLLLWSEHDRTKFLGLGLENGHLKIASNLLGSDNDTVATPSSGFITDGSWHMAKIAVDRSRLELQLDGEVIFTEKLAPQELMQISSTTSPHRTRARNSLMSRRGKEPTITYEDLFYLGKKGHYIINKSQKYEKFIELISKAKMFCKPCIIFMKTAVRHWSILLKKFMVLYAILR